MRRAFTVIEGAVCAVIILILAAIIAVPIIQYRGIHAGYVTGRTCHPAWTTYIMVGKIMVPQSYPERWTVTIAFNGKTNEWDVDQAVYLKADAGLWYDTDTGALTPQPVAEAK